MRIAHFSDLHYCPKYLAEVDRCFSAAVTQAICTEEGRPEVAVISGDLFDHRVDLDHECVSVLLSRVAELASVMPVLILQGTQSHDIPGSLDIFKTFDNVRVADTISQWYLMPGGRWNQKAIIDEPLAVFSCLPSVNKGQVAITAGHKEAAEATGTLVEELMRSWAPVHREMRGKGLPSIVVSHGTVNGCLTEHGVPMAGTDHEFSVGVLDTSAADAVMLGHIHKHQSWTAPNGTIIAYPGSIGRLHFGELDDKGWLMWNVDPVTKTTHELHVTPAKRLIHRDYDGPPDMADLRALSQECTGAHVRIRWCVDEEHRTSVDRDSIALMFENAEELKLEGRINPIQRQRAAGITVAESNSAKLAQWCDVTGTEFLPVNERLLTLEQAAIDEG
jgi:exonuclease SbcD